MAHINVEKPRLSGKRKANLRHNLFVDTYLSDPDRNGVKAYQKVYPNCSYNTANVNSSQLLSKTNIKQLIELKEAELLKNSSRNVAITRELITSQLQEDRLQAKELNQMSPAIKANEVLARMNGFLIEKSVTLNMTLEDLIRNASHKPSNDMPRQVVTDNEED